MKNKKDKAPKAMLGEGIKGLFMRGVITGVVTTIALAVALGGHDVEYDIVEDNSVETIISMQEGKKTTLISINRYEKGVWETTYNGYGVPVTKKVVESEGKIGEN